MSAGFRDGILVRIYLDAADRIGSQPAYAAVVALLLARGVAGATVFRGIQGFGGHNALREARVFAWLPDVPFLVEAVDERAVLEPLVPEIEALVGEGLLSIESARYLRLPR